MGEDVILYEAGLRIDDKYSQFIQSRNPKDVDEYIEIMLTTKPDDSEVVKLVKVYRCISTTPHIILK